MYYAAANTAYPDPTAKLDGTTPSGWTDLGLVKDSKVDLKYTKTIMPVETGLEKIRRGSYTMQKTCVGTFVLEQYDVDTLAAVSGLSITPVGSIGGKIHIGQDDLVEKALLFTSTNKVDGKEHHMYTSKASLNFGIATDGDMRVVNVTSDFYSFVPTGETIDAYFSLYVLD